MKDTALATHFIRPSQGLFITFEGVEGSGKSTQLKRLAEFFENQGREVLVLREPGGTLFGEKLRQTILNQTEPLDPLSETFVFLASRVQLLQEKILPFLAQPKAVVLLDRYIDSTLVYQGLAQGRPIDMLLTLHQFAPLNTLPHLTFFLDIDVETSLARQAQRGQTPDYFETRHKAFQQRLVEGYRTVQAHYSERIVRIDATTSQEHIATELIKTLTERQLV